MLAKEEAGRNAKGKRLLSKTCTCTCTSLTYLLSLSLLLITNLLIFSYFSYSLPSSCSKKLLSCWLCLLPLGVLPPPAPAIPPVMF